MPVTQPVSEMIAAARHAGILGRPGQHLSQTRLSQRQESGAVLCFQTAFGSGGPHPSGHGHVLDMEGGFTEWNMPNLPVDCRT